MISMGKMVKGFPFTTCAALLLLAIALTGGHPQTHIFKRNSSRGYREEQAPGEWWWQISIGKFDRKSLKEGFDRMVIMIISPIVI